MARGCAVASPDTARGWHDHACALERSGDADGALDAFRRASKLNARAAAPWVGLARLLQANHQHADASECLRRAVVAEPTNVTVRTLHAKSLAGQARLDEAEAEYLAALDRCPGDADASLGLGALYEDLGHGAKAAACYRQVLAARPGDATALGALLALGRQCDVADLVAPAETRLADERDPAARALISYGLGKELERLGAYPRAFAAYAAANAARRERAGRFDSAEFDRRIDALIALFSPAFFAERTGWGSASRAPVFIVGLPRSGTTLTESVLAAHPLVHGAGEIDALADLATALPDRLGRADPPWPAAILDATPAQIAAMADDYLRRLMQRAAAGEVRGIDKQPLNFFHVGLIALLFPNAQVLHCMRDPLDNLLSIFTENFGVDQRWSTDLADLAHYWHGYRRLMAHWRAVAPVRIVDARYEDMVGDLEANARRLVAALGLKWDPACLDFYTGARPVQTPSRWQVRRPVYTSSVARWRRFGDALAPLLEAIGR